MKCMIRYKNADSLRHPAGAEPPRNNEGQGAVRGGIGEGCLSFYLFLSSVVY